MSKQSKPAPSPQVQEAITKLQSAKQALNTAPAETKHMTASKICEYEHTIRDAGLDPSQY